MGFDNCSRCKHEFTKEDGDIPHADGGFMEINHGGGLCRPCYIEAGHPECECGKLNYRTSKFCQHCGLKLDAEGENEHNT